MRKKTMTKLTKEQLKLVSGGMIMSMPFGVRINSPLFVVNLNLGVLVVAGNNFNSGSVTVINFGQKI